MNKTNIIIVGLFLLFAGYFSYTVFLADDALVKRTVKTEGANGGYQIVTKLDDSSKIVETFTVNDAGSPVSHELIVVDSQTGKEIRTIKKGTFVPKFK